VPRADYTKNIPAVVHSPLHEFHSLSVICKLEESKELKLENMRLAGKLKAVDSTVSFAEQQKQWKEAVRRKKMAKKSKIGNACLGSCAVLDS
jgi:hypothetical protein